MAELPELGQHCSHPDCHQLDFLPVSCRGCDLVYCKNHSAHDKHSCSRQNQSVEKAPFTGIKSYKCEYKSCTNRELTPVVCPACENHFCLSHRHQVEHSCEKYEAPHERMTQTREHVKKILESKGTGSSSHKKKTGKSQKAKATAAKVALMKIKMNSVGDAGIPESERVFLKVALPSGSKHRSINVVVSNQWSIGKTVDYIAALAKCENRNNVAEAKKLRLFQSDSGDCVNIAATVKQCVEDQVFLSGSTMILEYVANGTDSLEHLHSYSI